MQVYDITGELDVNVHFRLENALEIMAMAERLTGRELRTVAWLVLLAEKHGAQLLDDPRRFDELLGSGQFAMLDRETLQLSRRYLEQIAKRSLVRTGGEQIDQEILKRQDPSLQV